MQDHKWMLGSGTAFCALVARSIGPEWPLFLPSFLGRLLPVMIVLLSSLWPTRPMQHRCLGGRWSRRPLLSVSLIFTSEGERNSRVLARCSSLEGALLTGILFRPQIRPDRGRQGKCSRTHVLLLQFSFMTGESLSRGFRFSKLFTKFCKHARGNTMPPNNIRAFRVLRPVSLLIFLESPT